MTKTQMISVLAHHCGLTKADASRCVDAVFDSKQGLLAAALAKGESVTLLGFGSFKIAKRKARDGRNLHTGKTIKIPARKVVVFHPGKALKDRIA